MGRQQAKAQEEQQNNEAARKFAKKSAVSDVACWFGLLAVPPEERVGR